MPSCSTSSSGSPAGDSGLYPASPAGRSCCAGSCGSRTPCTDAYVPIQSPRFLTDDSAAWEDIGRRGREKLAANGRYLEAELADRTWCLGGAFSVADIYLYMLKGWESYGDAVLGGEHVEAHFARVGARPAIARTRELDDLDERLLRHHPQLRAGKPID